VTHTSVCKKLHTTADFRGTGRIKALENGKVCKIMELHEIKYGCNRLPMKRKRHS
jgi:hypothetical protein